MLRFEKRKSLAGVLQPGDATRYEMVAVKLWNCIEVIVQNVGFFDKIIFIPSSIGTFEVYKTFRGEGTNPCTIKAAIEMMEMLVKEVKENE